jgi:release factor glutamine methyltransferase
MTLRESLERGTALLAAGPHADKARLDAEALLLHQTGKNRAWLIAHFDDDFSGYRAIGYASLLDRRAQGEPIQYIVGECEFYGMLFRVTPDVLIPRPETEHLVEKALALAQSFTTPRIVDVGTGSGAIAVALARHLADALVTASDISAPALELAETNAQHNAVAIRFVHGDLLAPVAGEVFDLIVSNPPYVPVRDRESMSIEVRDHEPAGALFAGEDGLDLYRHLIPSAHAALAKGGFIALEIGYGQQDSVRALLDGAGFARVEFTPDLQGIPRVATAQRI